MMLWLQRGVSCSFVRSSDGCTIFFVFLLSYIRCTPFCTIYLFAFVVFVSCELVGARVPIIELRVATTEVWIIKSSTVWRTNVAQIGREQHTRIIVTYNNDNNKNENKYGMIISRR